MSRSNTASSETTAPGRESRGRVGEEARHPGGAGQGAWRDLRRHAERHARLLQAGDRPLPRRRRGRGGDRATPGVDGLTLAAAACAAATAGAGLRVALARRRAPPLLAPAAEPPATALLVPMRDEAANADDCLETLLPQRGATRVVAIDDHSRDATPEILARRAAADPRLEVRAAPPLPPGGAARCTPSRPAPRGRTSPGCSRPTPTPATLRSSSRGRTRPPGSTTSICCRSPGGRRRAASSRAFWSRRSSSCSTRSSEIGGPTPAARRRSRSPTVSSCSSGAPPSSRSAASPRSP